jgi:hypothetical protein
VAAKALSHAVGVDLIPHRGALVFPRLSLSPFPLGPLAGGLVPGPMRWAVCGEKKNIWGEICQGVLKNKALTDE